MSRDLDDLCMKVIEACKKGNQVSKVDGAAVFISPIGSDPALPIEYETEGDFLDMSKFSAPFNNSIGKIMAKRLSKEQLEQRAKGTPAASPWEHFENGDFVDYYAPSIDGVYVSCPETGRHLFTSQNAAIDAATRYQNKVREYLTKNGDALMIGN